MPRSAQCSATDSDARYRRAPLLASLQPAPNAEPSPNRQCRCGKRPAQTAYIRPGASGPEPGGGAPQPVLPQTNACVVECWPSQDSSTHLQTTWKYLGCAVGWRFLWRLWYAARPANESRDPDSRTIHVCKPGLGISWY